MQRAPSPKAHVLSSLTFSAPALAWQQADDGVFVATLNGEYAGFVAANADGYDAHTGRGLDLGAHATAGGAASALADSMASAAAAPRASLPAAAPTAPAASTPAATRHRAARRRRTRARQLQS